MSGPHKLHIGSMSGGDAAGRALARATVSGVGAATAGLAAGQRIRIERLRVEIPTGADPQRVSDAVRTALLRRLAAERSGQ